MEEIQRRGREEKEIRRRKCKAVREEREEAKPGAEGSSGAKAEEEAEKAGGSMSTVSSEMMDNGDNKSGAEGRRIAQPSPPGASPRYPPPHFFEKRRRRRRHHLHWVTIHVLALVLSFICFSSTKFQRLQNQKLPPPLLFLFACVLSYKKIPLYGPSLNLKFLRKKMFGDFLNLKS